MHMKLVMPYKDKKRQREYKKKYNDEYYKKNKQYFLDRNNQLREDLKNMIKEKKENGSCKYCEENEPICLDFNHIDPKTKKFLIAEAPRLKVTRKQMKEEMDKCNLLCSNCHRKFHKYGIEYFNMHT